MDNCRRRAWVSAGTGEKLGRTRLGSKRAFVGRAATATSFSAAEINRANAGRNAPRTAQKPWRWS
jgi:hypothetical protein